MRKKFPRTNIEPGEFPFPNFSGARESRYLTWIRNHSNYMAVRGFLDYARVIGVLLRGIFVNSLVLIPLLVIFGGVVAAANLFSVSFRFTAFSLVGALGLVLAFPLCTPLFKIVRYRRRMATGSDSSVKMRDLFERLFGFMLILIIAVVGLESLSHFLGDFHRFRLQHGYGPEHLLSVSSVAAIIMSGTGRILELSPGLFKKLALVVIGIMGVVIPVLVILYIAEFLVFSPPSLDWSKWVWSAMLVLLILISLALLIGVFFGYRLVDFFKNLLMLVAVLAAFVAILVADETAYEFNGQFDERLYQSLREFEQVLSVSSDGEQLVFDPQAKRQGLALELRPGQIEKVAQKLTEDIASRIASGHGPLSELAGYAGTLTGSAAMKDSEVLNADELNELISLAAQEMSLQDAKQSVEMPRDDQQRYDELVRLARATFLPDLEEMVEKVKNRDKSQLDESAEQQISYELENLAQRLRAIPLKFYTGQSTAAFLKTLMSLNVSQLQNLQSPHCGNQAWCNDPYPQLSALSNIDASVRALNFWSEQLTGARAEVAIALNYSSKRYPEVYNTAAAKQVRRTGFKVKSILLATLSLILLWLVWITVDINLTSIHGLYRDRLATAFLVGQDTRGDIDIEKDLDLAEICCREAGSTAPYHLINTAINLQGSTDIGIRDRQADYFVFSKRFSGGHRTNYCRSEHMEQVFPQMGLSSAMAISAAAASPNMGRSTSPGLVMIMTLLNIRLGYWVPNPGRLESWLHARKYGEGKQGGYTFVDVFKEELEDITARWALMPELSERSLSNTHPDAPSTEHGLVGIGYSGGGIRSATLNLGITQALYHSGVFDHVDYMSTVSGGGYLGASISALMRRRTRTFSEYTGKVSVSQPGTGETIVSVSRPAKGGLFTGKTANAGESRDYRYSESVNIAVRDSAVVRKGRRLIHTGIALEKRATSLGNIFKWRVRPTALLRELFGKLNETHRWVNVSDGGHIENLAGIELIRRRCKFVIIGDGEADPEHSFNGMATLIRSARIDLGVEIDINLVDLKLSEDGLCNNHFAVGKIHYPEPEPSVGYLLYLKSSLSGDEDEVIQQYRRANSTFPHESTADQMFSEGQFEAYRSLGLHIGEHVLKQAKTGENGLSYAELEQWFETLYQQSVAPG